MNTIWDRSEGKLIKASSAAVPSKFSGWVRTEFNAVTQPNKPHRIIVKKADGIRWAISKTQPTGTVAQYYYICDGGCEPKNKNKPSLQPDESPFASI